MFDMDRRALLERTLQLVGAAATSGFSVVALAQDKAPQLLDAAQFALLSAVADTIVPVTDTPGAIAAGVPRAFDALLRNWASNARRTELIGALRAIDAAAREKAGQPFAKLTAAKRYEVLAAHDAAAMRTAPGRAEPATSAVAGVPSLVDPRVDGSSTASPPADASGTPRIKARPVTSRSGVADPAYAKLRELIVVLFYVSETALTHDLAFEHDPGSWDPSIPITPQTRRYGGNGLTERS